MSIELYQVKERKYEHPNEIHKVPVQPDFFHHFVVSSSLVNARYSVVIHHEVETNPTKHVEAVETGYEEEKGGKIRGSVLVEAQRRSYSCSVDEVSPFPGLAAKEGNSTEDCPEHPL